MNHGTRISTLEKMLDFLRPTGVDLSMSAGFSASSATGSTVHFSGVDKPSVTAREVKQDALASILECCESLSKRVASTHVVIVEEQESGVSRAQASIGRTLCANVVAANHGVIVTYVPGVRAFMNMQQRGSCGPVSELIGGALVVSIDRSKGLPEIVGLALATFPDSGESNRITISQDAGPQFAFRVEVGHPSMAGRLSKGRLVTTLHSMLAHVLRLEEVSSSWRGTELPGVNPLAHDSGTVSFFVKSETSQLTVQNACRQILIDALGFSAWRDEMSTRRLLELGADSRMAVEISTRLESELGIHCPSSLLQANITIDDLFKYALGQNADSPNADSFVPLEHVLVFEGAC